MDDLERGLRLVAEHSERARFVGPRDPALVASAEAAIGLRFPPSYRRFVTELGAGSIAGEEFYGVIGEDWTASPPDAVGLTLKDHRNGDLPSHYIVVGDTDEGERYALDTSEAGGDGEHPVYIVTPGVDAEDAPPERVADDFGSYFHGRLSEAFD
jgi:hypothetical protein